MRGRIGSSHDDSKKVRRVMDCGRRTETSQQNKLQKCPTTDHRHTLTTLLLFCGFLVFGVDVPNFRAKHVGRPQNRVSDSTFPKSDKKKMMFHLSNEFVSMPPHSII